jgi:hypothetical protein
MRLAVLSVYLTLATLSLSANGREFSHSRDLPPLKLASADLDSILLKAQSLIAAANGPSGEQDSARESVKLGVSDKEIEIPHFSRASSVAFPKQLFRFSYAYYRPDKPISSVTLDFSDYSRRVSVTGEAADQVQSITNLLENDLLRHSTRIGGAMFRRVVGVGLSVALLVSLIVSSAYWWNTRSHSTSGMLVCSVLALLLLLFVPWQRYLAGFALYQSYSPFLLIRYAAPIFFLSLIATILSIPYCIFFRDGDGKHNHLCKQPLLCTTLPCRLIGAKHAEANRWGCWWCSCLVSHRQCRQSRIARDVARLFRSRSRQDVHSGNVSRAALAWCHFLTVCWFCRCMGDQLERACDQVPCGLAAYHVSPRDHIVGTFSTLASCGLSRVSRRCYAAWRITLSPPREPTQCSGALVASFFVSCAVTETQPEIFSAP